VGTREWFGVARPRSRILRARKSFSYSTVATIFDVLIEDDSNNVCKGYANIGLISNLENSIASIGSIPAIYDVSINFASLFSDVQTQ